MHTYACLEPRPWAGLPLATGRSHPQLRQGLAHFLNDKGTNNNGSNCKHSLANQKTPPSEPIILPCIVARRLIEVSASIILTVIQESTQTRVTLNNARQNIHAVNRMSPPRLGSKKPRCTLYLLISWRSGARGALTREAVLGPTGDGTQPTALCARCS